MTCIKEVCLCSGADSLSRRQQALRQRQHIVVQLGEQTMCCHAIYWIRPAQPTVHTPATQKARTHRRYPPGIGKNTIAALQQYNTVSAVAPITLPGHRHSNPNRGSYQQSLTRSRMLPACVPCTSSYCCTEALCTTPHHLVHNSPRHCCCAIGSGSEPRDRPSLPACRPRAPQRAIMLL